MSAVALPDMAIRRSQCRRHDCDYRREQDKKIEPVTVRCMHQGRMRLSFSAIVPI
jgi:hypothetical protein